MAVDEAEGVDGLDGSSEAAGFFFERDFNGGAAGVGEELAPSGGTGASADDEHAIDRRTALNEVEPIEDAKADAFNGGADEILRRKVGGGDAGEGSASVRQVGGALAVEEGEEDEAVGSGGCGGECEFDVVHGFAEGIEGLRDDVGRVHGADEGEPAVGGGTEWGDVARGVEHRLIVEGVNGGRGAEAERDDAFADVAGADGSHHIVSTTSGDDAGLRKAEVSGYFGAQGADWFVDGDERRESGEELAGAAIDGVEDFAGPAARADVEEGSAGGVTVLGAHATGEPEVEVFVRQEDVADACEVFGLVILEPEELGDGVAGERNDPKALEVGLFAAEEFDELLVFGRGLGVVPELGGADDVVVLVEDDQAVLLAGDTERLHGFAGRLRESLANGRAEGIDPPLGLLLAGTRLAFDERVESVAAAEGGSIFVDQQGLGALCAAVNSEIHRSHYLRVCKLSQRRPDVRRCTSVSELGAKALFLWRLKKVTGSSELRAIAYVSTLGLIFFACRI
jgi:hypothetical protein